MRLAGLARSFNQMTLKLKNSYQNLEAKVQEKTQELASRMEEIQHAKAHDEAIIASIGDGLIATDREGKIILMNNSAEIMLGFKASDMIGKLFTETVPIEDERNNIIPTDKRPIYMALTSGRKVATIAYYWRQDKTKFPVAVTVSPIILKSNIIGAIGIFRDITREKEIDEMKTEFISTVSHELRTPLTTVREGVSQVYDGILGDTTAEQREFLSIALQDIDRLKRIIDSLLDISKIEEGKIELRKTRVDVTEIAKQVYSTFHPRVKSKQLELKTALPSKPAYILCGPGSNHSGFYELNRQCHKIYAGRLH